VWKVHQNMRTSWRLVGGVAALAALVFSGNLFGPELNSFFLRFPGIDKVFHTVTFLLVFVCVYFLSRRMSLQPANRALLAATIAILLALTDELLQNLAPGRNVEVLDVAANFSGVALGWLLVSPPPRRLALATAAAALSVAGYATYDTYVTLIDFSRAQQYERKHDFVQAREHYLRALQKGLRTSALYNELGWVEVESGVGDPAKALEYARSALEMQPDNPDILDTYGWALQYAGRPTEALSYLQRAFEADPAMYCIHYHLGAAYFALGRRDLAEAHFRRQLELPGTREAALAAQALERMKTDSSMNSATTPVWK